MPTASRSTWKGALDVLGIPFSVELYSRFTEDKALSFKYLIDKKPAKQVYISTADFEKREQANKPSQHKVGTRTQSETSQGVEVEAGQYQVIPAAEITKIKDADRSRLVEPRAFVPLEAVPLELAKTSYVVVPHGTIPGAEGACQLLWNMLLHSGLAYTTELTARAGSRDWVLVVYAREDGLHAAALPFEAELKDVPEFTWVRDAKTGKRMTALLQDEDADVEILEEWDHSIYVSAHRERRLAAIEAATSGKEIKPPKEPPKPKPADANELMASLEAQVKAKKPGQRRTGKTIKPKAKKKVAA